MRTFEFFLCVRHPFSGRKSPKCQIFQIFISQAYDVTWLQNLQEIIITSSYDLEKGHKSLRRSYSHQTLVLGMQIKGSKSPHVKKGLVTTFHWRWASPTGTLQLLVRWLVGYQKLSYFPRSDLHNFRSEVRYQNSKNSHTAGLSKKNLDHSIIQKTCHFWGFFDFWRKSSRWVGTFCWWKW